MSTNQINQRRIKRTNEYFQKDPSIGTYSYTEIGFPSEFLEKQESRKKEKKRKVAVFEKMEDESSEPGPRCKKPKLDPWSGAQIIFINSLRNAPRMSSFPHDKGFMDGTRPVSMFVAPKHAPALLERKNPAPIKEPTKLSDNLKHVLGNFFILNPTPSPERMKDIGKMLNLDYKTVQNYFSNSRRNERRRIKREEKKLEEMENMI